MNPIKYLALLLVLVAGGCSQPAATTKSDIAISDPEKSAMADKLAGMTPDERARYVQDHPGEINSAFSNVKPPKP